MSRYIAQRILQGIITLFILGTLVFVLARVIGNPVDLMLDSNATLEDREMMIHQLGLDRPYYVQYAEFMGGLIRGDLGHSIKFDQPVLGLFLQLWPNTVKLAAFALTIAMVFGLTLGIVAGTHRDSPIDRFCTALAVLGMSAPAFWLGLILMIVFAVRLDLLPVARMGGPASYILPGFTWSFFLLAGTARLVRSSMIEVLDSEYVKLARIKGVSPNMVVWKHCLRNVLIPVVTFAGVQLAHLLSGSVVIESVFAWPGTGRLLYQGIVGRDYPLVQGCLLIVGSIIVAISVVVDILYSFIDPRIRVLGGKQ